MNNDRPFFIVPVSQAVLPRDPGRPYPCEPFPSLDAVRAAATKRNEPGFIIARKSPDGHYRYVASLLIPLRCFNCNKLYLEHIQETDKCLYAPTIWENQVYSVRYRERTDLP